MHKSTIRKLKQQLEEAKRSRDATKTKLKMFEGKLGGTVHSRLGLDLDTAEARIRELQRTLGVHL